MGQKNVIITRINRNFGGFCAGERSASRGQYFTTVKRSTFGFQRGLKEGILWRDQAKTTDKLVLESVSEGPFHPELHLLLKKKKKVLVK